MINEKITPELIKKAKSAESPDELIALANEYGFELTKEEAAAHYSRLHSSAELADEELDNVSGGGCILSSPAITCPQCKSTNIAVSEYHVYAVKVISDYVCKACGHNFSITSEYKPMP